MPRFLLALLYAACVLAIPKLSFAQTPPQSDPQALSYAAQSIAALTGGTSITDLTLTGNVTWNGTGSDIGTATLKARGTGESRIDLALSSGTRTEIRDSQTGIAIGQWLNPNGTSGPFSYQSCQTDAVWFFPALGSLAAGPNVVLSYIGQETRNGETVQHIRSSIYQTSPSAGTVSTQQFSTMDFFLDATTFVPVAMIFNAYPDDSSALAMPVEVDFFKYQNKAGVLVPSDIQRYLQGNLLVDLTITGAAFNTGIPLSTFSVNQAAARVMGRQR